MLDFTVRLMPAAKQGSCTRMHKVSLLVEAAPLWLRSTRRSDGHQTCGRGMQCPWCKHNQQPEAVLCSIIQGCAELLLMAGHSWQGPAMDFEASGWHGCCLIQSDVYLVANDCKGLAELRSTYHKEHADEA